MEKNQQNITSSILASDSFRKEVDVQSKISSDVVGKMCQKEMRSEIDKDTRLADSFTDNLLNKLSRIITIEASGKDIPNRLRKKYLMTAGELINKTFVRISLGNIYRRYAAIRIQALTEALAIAQQNENRDAVVSKIIDKIKEIGEPLKEARSLQR